MSAESRQGRVVVGLTEGPGLAYGVRLLEVLAQLPVETHLVMSRGATRSVVRETGRVPEEVRGLAHRVYAEENQAARISSGSFLTLGMAIAPCSASSLASIGQRLGESQSVASISERSMRKRWRAGVVALSASCSSSSSFSRR